MSLRRIHMTVGMVADLTLNHLWGGLPCPIKNLKEGFHNGDLL